jgi:Arc/MetJ-type ribon-helix-helix transcriptional regulator
MDTQQTTNHYAIIFWLAVCIDEDRRKREELDLAVARSSYKSRSHLIRDAVMRTVRKIHAKHGDKRPKDAKKRLHTDRRLQ